MNIENFRILREIASHIKRLSDLSRQITDELKRVDRIGVILETNKIELREIQEKFEETNQSSADLESKLDKIQRELEQLEKSEKNLTTQKQLEEFNRQKEFLNKRKEELEQQALEKLLEIEELEKSIEESQDFVDGATKSLKEVTQEVDDEVEKLNGNKRKLEERVDSLLEEVPSNFKSKIDSLRLKKAESPLSFMKNRKCEYCKFSVTPADAENLEIKYQLVCCQSCGRILLPEEIATS